MVSSKRGATHATVCSPRDFFSIFALDGDKSQNRDDPKVGVLTDIRHARRHRVRHATEFIAQQQVAGPCRALISALSSGVTKVCLDGEGRAPALEIIRIFAG